MIKVQATISGVEAVTARLGGSGSAAALRARLRGAVDRTAEEVRNDVIDVYLAGPRPQRLVTGGPGNTGRLGRSINVRRFEDTASIGASVGTNVVYGRLWELGFSGVEHVREHSRRITKATRSGKRRTIGTTSVRAHDRKVNIAPRPFLRPALDDRRAAFRERVRRAVSEAP